MLIQLVIQENSFVITVVSRANMLCHKMSISKCRHKMQEMFMALCLIGMCRNEILRIL